MAFHFDNCVLDTARRELRRGPDLVEVEPQVFDLLVFLIENRDRVVSKDDILATVWGGRTVSESAIASRLNGARSAIGDNGDAQRLIRTFPRRGFRFVGEVRDEAAPAVDATAPPAGETNPATVVSPSDPVGPAPHGRKRAAGIAAAAIVLLAGAFLMVWRAGWLSPSAHMPTHTFDARLVPIVVSDQVRTQLEDYPSLPDFKAVAISDLTAVRVSGAPDAATARQRALESCRIVSVRRPNTCTIYAVGMDVVFDRTLLVLPAREDLRTKPYDQALRVGDLPLPPQTWELIRRYDQEPEHKAIAVSASLMIYTYYNIKGDPIQRAIEHCGFVTQKPCMIISVDGQLTVRLPASHTIIGIFLPRNADELPAADRERIAHVYDRDDWRALVRGHTGWYPVSGAKSESDAVAAAMADCSKGDTNCVIHAIGNFRVADRK